MKTIKKKPPAAAGRAASSSEEKNPRITIERAGAAYEINIREYRREDYPALVEIWKAGEIVLDETDMEDALEENLKRRESFRVLVADARRVQASGKQAAGKTSLAGGLILTYDGRRAFIYHFAVHPEFRGMGLGKKLLESCEQQARSWGARHLRLLARTDSARAPAHKLYESMNWKADKNIWLYRKSLT